MTANTISGAVTMTGGEGTLLAGRYRIVRQLGRGGMGSVWLAEDTQLDNKQFAIKMLPSILVSNKRAYRQLKDEALVAMKLTHTSIVTLRAFEENNGNPFLVMDYIDGQTLDDYLAEKGKLSEDETIKLLKPIASALDYAHGEGVIHRDVKPANVMIRKDGHPYILDFGIAREIQETMTRVTGKLSSGTLLYMSPEQLHGAAPKKEQDIYSFAVMAYECLSGNPPFSRGQVEYQIDNDMPEPLDPHIIISGMVAQGLSKHTEDRPSNCAAVLEGNGSRRGAEARRRDVVGHASSTGDSPVRGGAWKIVATLAVIAFAVAGGWLWRQDVQKESTRLTERNGAIVEHKTEEVHKAADESQRKTAEEAQCGVQREDVTRIADKMHRVAKSQAAEKTKHGDATKLVLPGGVKMDMIYVVPGSFIMGSDSGYSDERPAHKVTLTKGFWLGKYEVTQLQWQSVMGDNPSYFKGDQRPVEGISRDACRVFCERVNERIGKDSVRLPTEAEWEYACRAGTTGKFGGAGNLDNMGWYASNSSGYGTHPVGQKMANAWGFYDMHGNVAELCSDSCGSYEKEEVVDPKGSYSVSRGGCWHNNADGCTSSFRGGSPGFNACGFRLCCDRMPNE